MTYENIRSTLSRMFSAVMKPAQTEKQLCGKSRNATEGLKAFLSVKIQHWRGSEQEEEGEGL